MSKPAYQSRAWVPHGTRVQAGGHLPAGCPLPRSPHCGLEPAQSFGRPCSYLPEKGAVRRGILKGASVRKWQGCTLEGDGPPRPSGSTETMAAVAAMVMVGLLPTGLRLLWRPPAEEDRSSAWGCPVATADRGHVIMQHASTQKQCQPPFLSPTPHTMIPEINSELSKCQWCTERTHGHVTPSESQC